MVAKQQFMYMLSSSPYDPLIKKKKQKQNWFSPSLSEKLHNENSLTFINIFAKDTHEIHL